MEHVQPTPDPRSPSPNGPGAPARELPSCDGLAGIVAARTLLSSVDGERGELLLRGRRVEEVAPTSSFEDMVELLLGDREGPEVSTRLRLHREVPEATLALLAARREADPMDALRMAVSSLTPGGSRTEQAAALLGCLPGLVAAHHRLRVGREPVPATDHPGLVADYLHRLDGEEPSPARVRALETYLATVSDHGMNASTFTARVIASTRSDLVSAVTGAIGALKGPLHGGAPGPALDMVFEIGSAERARPMLRERLDRGERLMGFGHRIYRVRDPRADVLAEASRRLASDGESRELVELAGVVEREALALLAERKPDRVLQTNVEYYTALLLHAVGLPGELFTPTFAVGRCLGWIAHCFEQQDHGRLIRPASEYVGPRP